MIMLPGGWCRAWWCLAFPVLLLLWSSCLCREVQSNVASVLVPGGVAVQHVQPARVTQYIRTQLTVVLNGSLCDQLGQVPLGDLQLVLQGAAAGGRNLTFHGTSGSSNCSSWDFTVQPNGTAQPGSFAAYLVLPKQRVSLRLPRPIAVEVPLLLSMRSHTVNASADTSAFAVRVQLNAPAGPGGVTVRLQLMNDAGAVRVFRDTVTWAAGASGSQAFWLALQNSPSSGQLLVQLQQPQGAVLDRSATSTVVEVQSPVVGFKTDLGYYRGVNNSTPRVYLTVAGASAFSSQFVFHTFLLPGSRPAAVPCHPLASSCSVAELEAVNNITVTGMRWLAPGQQQLEPIDLPINWGRLPPEAELRVAVRIEPKFNTRVAPQAGQVAVIVFGTPPGRCPPGSTLLSSDAPSGAGKLLLASSRWGDVVVVDATACDELQSDRFQVAWRRKERMWRQRYPLTGQRSPCWLRVHVFTRNDADLAGAASTADVQPSSSSSSSSSNEQNKTSSSMWDLPADFVLYRSYTIRFIPLRPPEQLSLRAITFSNSGTTVIAPRQWPPSPAQNPKCTVCPNGTYSTRVDADECKVCPPGKYAASPFSTSCLFCPPGSFSYYWGAPACRTCLPGTFAAEAGSLFCNICRDGSTTSSEGATSCDVSLSDGGSVLDSQGASEYAILLSFGVVLDGTLLEAVTRSTTGINGSSEGIVAVLVASDTASALNVSLGSVQVLAVQQIGSRQLLVNVSATVPVEAEGEAAAATTQDLSADELIQRLVDDPNTFLRTTQTLGAESASVQDIITQRTRRARLGAQGRLHAVLWPTLLGSLLLLSALLYMCWRWRRAVELHAGNSSSSDGVRGGFRAFPQARGSNAGSSSSGESSPGSGSQSARSDELCVTVEMGECPLSEESFTARLRAKQLGSAAGVLHSSSRQYPPPPGGSW
ncbi:hypothetical protein OEZ86_012169 [Tetradesmus obliquus]|nr:hypothetical protein OEZ86_012169 [Tetradesmus obliquus]